MSVSLSRMEKLMLLNIKFFVQQFEKNSMDNQQPSASHQQEVLLFEYEKSIIDFTRTYCSPNTLESSSQLPLDGSYSSATDSISKPNTQLRHITRLEIYDFDSTLFRSPLPSSDLWTPALKGKVMADCAWFSEPRTLETPYIPLVPENTWWHDETIAHALNALSNKNTLTVLLTGRRHDRFSARIQKLCLSKQPEPLAFDLFIMREGHDSTLSRHYATTLDFKLAVLDKLLQTFPHIDHIEIHDDRERHLKLFQRQCEAMVAHRRISTFKMHYVVHERTLNQFIAPHLEKSLVLELVENCNIRIRNAMAREVEMDASKAITPVTNPSNLRAEPIEYSENAQTSCSVYSKSAGLQSINESSAIKESCCNTLNASLPSELSTSNSIPLSNTIKTKKLDSGISTKLQRQFSSNNTHSSATNSRLPSRRISISNFRVLIEPTDTVRFTSITLDDDSRSALLKMFPTPDKWKPHARHMIVSFGNAPDAVIEAIGGIGARIYMLATGFGEVHGRAQAVRVESNALSCITASANSTMYITLCVSSTGALNDPSEITNWNTIQPLELYGTLERVMITDLKSSRTQGGSSGSLSQFDGNNVPKQVSIGVLVKKHHPTLQGKQVGKACEAVNLWMSKTFIENLENNRAEIEFYIQSQSFQ
ncbi:hypothetical protein BDV3_006060 [Batrachochytrium dendrobatidis]